MRSWIDASAVCALASRKAGARASSHFHPLKVDYCTGWYCKNRPQAYVARHITRLSSTRHILTVPRGCVRKMKLPHVLFKVTFHVPTPRIRTKAYLPPLIKKRKQAGNPILASTYKVPATLFVRFQACYQPCSSSSCSPQPFVRIAEDRGRCQ